MNEKLKDIGFYAVALIIGVGILLGLGLTIMVAAPWVSKAYDAAYDWSWCAATDKPEPSFDVDWYTWKERCA